MTDSHVVVVGAGIFGLATAMELSDRGYGVTIIESSVVPNPLAASTDISKVVRMEYGADAQYTELAEEARLGWIAWNEEWMAGGLDPLYHETGVLMCCMRPMAAGGFENDSFEVLQQRGHKPLRLDAEALRSRFPAWRTGRYVDGFYHSLGGYVESGRVLTRLVDKLRARRLVEVIENVGVTDLAGKPDRVNGVILEDGREIPGDHVVLAAGAWTSKLYPELKNEIRSTGHPVFHLEPATPKLFEQDLFPTFTADVARTGFYGFPLNADGVVKIGVHGVGVSVDADAPRSVSSNAKSSLVQFLNITFPDLLSSKLVLTRLCLYADTPGEDFLIDTHPTRRGITVASGGSGHAFKFGPVLGSLVADAVEGKPPRFGRKFSWIRFWDTPDGEWGSEAARCRDSSSSRMKDEGSRMKDEG